MNLIRVILTENHKGHSGYCIYTQFKRRKPICGLKNHKGIYLGREKARGCFVGGWWYFIFWSICSLYWCAHIMKIHQFVNSEFVQFLNRWWFSSSAPCPNTRIPRGPSKRLELFCCDSLAGVLLASSGQRPEMLVNRQQYRRQPLSTQTSGSKHVNRSKFKKSW